MKEKVVWCINVDGNLIRKGWLAENDRKNIGELCEQEAGHCLVVQAENRIWWLWLDEAVKNNKKTPDILVFSEKRYVFVEWHDSTDHQSVIGKIHTAREIREKIEKILSQAVLKEEGESSRKVWFVWVDRDRSSGTSARWKTQLGRIGNRNALAKYQDVVPLYFPCNQVKMLLL